MKRYLIILVCTLFVAGAVAPVAAVEKKEKSGTTQQTPPKPKAVQPPAKKPAGKVAPKYDNFVDKNHNGIDDRKETTKIKDDPGEKPKAGEKKPAEKKPGA